MAVNQQQLDYLSAMGIPVWISRDLLLPTNSVNEQAPKPETEIATPESVVPKKGLQTADELIKDLQKSPTEQIVELVASVDEPKVATPLPRSGSVDEANWLELEAAVSQCTACDLNEKRQHTVFGSGNQQAKLMVVGDIPRLLDEEQKQPFAGEAGELLGNMLMHSGIQSDTVYFTNLLKCRPPLDNSPTPNQSASCLAYLFRQIKLLQPELVLLMGRSTAQCVLGKQEAMAQLRQLVHQLDGFEARFVVTYHPAYLLKLPRLKALAWQDLQLVQRSLVQHG